MSKGNVRNGSTSYSYSYNANGQRIGASYLRTLGTGGLNSVQTGEVMGYAKKFYYDNVGRLIAESNIKELCLSDSMSEDIIYLYDENSIIGMVYTNIDGTNTYYFLRNLLGDVIAIYDANGNKVVEYDYDAWGNCTIKSTTTNLALAHANPIRYRGYYYDEDTKLYYLNSRYYSPEFRRFISPDDTAYLDPENVNGLNLYCYCNNDPVNFVDPFGNSPTEWWEWLLAGAIVVGLAVGAVFTGGLLGGALLGASIGAGLSLGTQAIQGELNWAQFALDTGVGAISGMLGVSSASKFVTTSVGVFVGGASNIASQLISGASINDFVWWKVFVSAGIGGIAGYFGGAGTQNVKALNSTPKVSKAMASVNKVLSRMNTGYYSSARYAKAAFTNVSNRLAKAIIQEQTNMLVGSMLWYGGSTIVNNFLTGVF
jgi:RHS repeat-associated protein